MASTASNACFSGWIQALSSRFPLLLLERSMQFAKIPNALLYLCFGERWILFTVSHNYDRVVHVPNVTAFFLHKLEWFFSGKHR